VPPPAINSANQKAVAADVLDTATNASIPLLALDTMTSLRVTQAAVASRRPSVAAVARVLRSAPPQPGTAVLAASGSQPLHCESGSGTLSGQLAGASGLVAGDTVTIAADHCRVTVDNVPVTTTGRLTMTVTSGTFDPANPRFHFVLRVEAQDFTTETPTESDLARGTQQVEVDESGTGQGSMTVSGAMTYRSATAAGTHVSTLSDGTQTFTHDGDRVALNAAGGVATSNRFVGDLSYRLGTPASLTWSGDTFTGGSLRADATGSALVMTPVGNAAFRLELDDNGDGATELTSEAKESELGDLL
jgi:uncharacterized protein YraI